jgi:hypothetical protein
MADSTVRQTPAATKGIFGPKKKADSIIFRLLVQNKKTRPDTPKYPPYIRIPNTDIIVWKDKDGNEGNRSIRLLPGEKSIFVDEQEANGRVIPIQVLNNPNNRIEIIDGDIRCKPHETTKIQFLDLCNRNRDSAHSTGRTMPIFSRYNGARSDKERIELEKLKGEAILKSQTADEKIIAEQVKLLRIAMEDDYTNESRSDDAILADYYQVASEDPKRFLETYEAAEKIVKK